MEVYKFIVWADTHWDKFAAKCVTLDDTDKVERAIFERAKSGGFDFTLFAGDRYLKREPDDETKVRADRVLYDLVHPGNIPHYHLIGNHDWVDNTRKWHTAESLKILNNVHVMDESKTWKYKNARIHALPADFEMNMSNYEIDPSCLNLFVFHDMVIGTFMNEDHTMSFESGMPLSDIDCPEFDFVLAGDIHIRQPFPFKNTLGGYLGSVVQRTRADSNRERGWTEMIFTKTGSGWDHNIKFVPTKNLFTRTSFSVDETTQMKDLKLEKSDAEDQLVEIKLVGDKMHVDRIADDPGWYKLEKKLKARKIEILRAYEAQQSEVVVDLTSSVSSVGDLELYLESSFSSVGFLKKEDILETVRTLSGSN